MCEKKCKLCDCCEHCWHIESSGYDLCGKNWTNYRCGKCNEFKIEYYTYPTPTYYYPTNQPITTWAIALPENPSIIDTVQCISNKYTGCHNAI